MIHKRNQVNQTIGPRGNPNLPSPDKVAPPRKQDNPAPKAQNIPAGEAKKIPQVEGQPSPSTSLELETLDSFIRYTSFAISLSAESRYDRFRRDLKALFWPMKDDQAALPELPPAKEVEAHQLSACPFYYLWLGTMAGIKLCLTELTSDKDHYHRSLHNIDTRLNPNIILPSDLEILHSEIHKLIRGNASLIAQPHLDLTAQVCPNRSQVTNRETAERKEWFSEDASQAYFVIPEGTQTPQTASPSKSSKAELRVKENGALKRFFKSAAAHYSNLKTTQFPVAKEQHVTVVYLPDDLPVNDEFYDMIQNSTMDMIEVTPPYPLGLLQSIIDVLGAFFDKSPKTNNEMVTHSVRTDGKTTITAQPQNQELISNNSKIHTNIKNETPMFKPNENLYKKIYLIAVENTTVNKAETSITDSPMTVNTIPNNITVQNFLNNSKSHKELTGLGFKSPFSQYPLPNAGIVNNIYTTEGIIRISKAENFDESNEAIKRFTAFPEISNKTDNLESTADQIDVATTKSRINFFPNFKQKKLNKNIENQSLLLTKINDTQLINQDAKLNKTNGFNSIWGIMGFTHKERLQTDTIQVSALPTTVSNISSNNASSTLFFINSTESVQYFLLEEPEDKNMLEENQDFLSSEANQVPEVTEGIERQNILFDNDDKMNLYANISHIDTGMHQQTNYILNNPLNVGNFSNMTQKVEDNQGSIKNVTTEIQAFLQENQKKGCVYNTSQLEFL